jgi:Fur family peroxide stress response transcriptional regulator
MKYSRQRELIEQIVKETDQHLTAEQVYQRVKPMLPSISLATVYRNLTQLAELKEIRRLHIPHGSVRFDSNIENHAHVICDVCGRIIDWDLSIENEFYEKIKRETGVTATGYSLAVMGICQSCAEKEEING